MKATALDLLESLIRDYDELATTKAKRPIPFSATIGNESGGIYVRKMAITNVFCLSNLQFDENIRGEGVLTRFIEYIIANPNEYSGVSVELIHNSRLVEHLKSLGFSLQSIDPISDEHAPTLLFSF
ncbi:hypothetical protein [Vibrio owensii]|uniref:hypothetical protein n=1 Tax=Vibrio harveyi group TaxID=717610 RepID=UPI003CC66A0D